MSPALRALAGAPHLRGGSPCRAGALRSVSEGNGVAARRGREQQEETCLDQPGTGRVFRPGSRRAGVRASLVASQPGNAGGAKGRRKVDGVRKDRSDKNRHECPNGLDRSDPRSLRETGHEAMDWTPAGRAEKEREGNLGRAGAGSGPLTIPRRVGPLEGEPPTGKPDAGDPPVRFGGRGCCAQRHSLPLSGVDAHPKPKGRFTTKKPV